MFVCLLLLLQGKMNDRLIDSYMPFGSTLLSCILAALFEGGLAGGIIWNDMTEW